MIRRDFLRKTALTLVTVTGVLAAMSYFRQFFPRRAGERRRINIGDPSRYPVDTFTFLEEHNLFVYRDHEGIRAVSSICTHLGCTVEATTEGFECPCHGSHYDLKGEVVSGPAPRKLAWYKVDRISDGRVIIDPGVTVDAEEKFLTA